MAAFDVNFEGKDPTSIGQTKVITKNTLRGYRYQYDEEANIWKPKEVVHTYIPIEEAPPQAPWTSPNLTSTAHFQEEVWQNFHRLELVQQSHQQQLEQLLENQQQMMASLTKQEDTLLKIWEYLNFEEGGSSGDASV